jgi:hypothetical protein
MMNQLPADFAETLARVVEPGHHAAVAEVIEAATLLDDDDLRMFLEKFAARIRSSPEPVRREELLQFLRESKQGGSPSAS